MFETTQDIFYIVLSASILLFTIFLCWSLFYLIRLLKQTNEVLRDLKEKFEHVSSVFSFLKGKLVTEALKGIVGFVKNKRQKNKKTKKQQ